MRRFAPVHALLALIIALLVYSTVASADTATTKNKGLLISPLRQYTSQDAGSQQTGNFTIANLTDKPLTVNLSVKQFSVSDYAYNYRFSPPNDWLKLAATQVPLKSGESSSISYSIDVPAKTAAGGQYYTLLASADVETGSLDSTVQAATLLYLTVNGRLIRTSQLIGNSINRVVFGKQLHYTVDTRNTGNVHYSAYYSGQLHGIFTRSTNGTSHLLLPGAIRSITGDIDSPILPGVYKATYGYKTDAGTVVMQAGWIVFLPPWSLAGVGLLILIGMNLRNRRKTNSSATPKESTNSV